MLLLLLSFDAFGYAPKQKKEKYCSMGFRLVSLSPHSVKAAEILHRIVRKEFAALKIIFRFKSSKMFQTKIKFPFRESRVSVVTFISLSHNTNHGSHAINYDRWNIKTVRLILFAPFFIFIIILKSFL